MTALTAPGATPANDAELIRSFHDRLRALETSPTTRVGDWVLASDPLDGALKAFKPGTTIDLSAPVAAQVVNLSGLSDAVTGPQVAAALTGDPFSSLFDLSFWSDTLVKLTGGLLNLSWIPGLDASKIISGAFPLSMISGLLDVGGKIATSLLTVPLSIITGLLSGGSILGSLIPGLDASKIISGAFPLGMITGLLDVGGSILTSLIPILDPSKILNLPGLFTNVSTGFANIFNNWFGGTSATGTPGEVATTIAAMKTAVLGGYTITIFSASNHSWAIPAGVTDMTGIVIGGGGRGVTGATGGSGTALGGAGGSSGGYLSAELDLTGLTPGTSTLDVTVGAAAATAGGNGAVSSIVASTGTLLASAVNSSGLATKEGLIATTSKPGKGGRGGDVTGSGPSSPTISSVGTGTTGEDSGRGSGGGGGGGVSNSGTATGGAGVAGQAGASTDVPLCGGAGGGGGGAAGTTAGFIGAATGGAGGNGGYPGGGSGGGGAAMNASGAVNVTGGAPGAAANGLVALIYK